MSQRHPVGRWKAGFFRLMGFDESNFDKLMNAFRDIVDREEVQNVIYTDYGTKCVVKGGITGPNGRSGYVVTVWVIETGQSDPRLVTAYPE